DVDVAGASDAGPQPAPQVGQPGTPAAPAERVPQPPVRAAQLGGAAVDVAALGARDVRRVGRLVNMVRVAVDVQARLGRLVRGEGQRGAHWLSPPGSATAGQSPDSPHPSSGGGVSPVGSGSAGSSSGASNSGSISGSGSAGCARRRVVRRRGALSVGPTMDGGRSSLSSSAAYGIAY